MKNKLKHPHSAALVATGVYKGLSTFDSPFDEYVRRAKALPDTTQMGESFEVLWEICLHIDPVHQAKEVYPVGTLNELDQDILDKYNLTNDSDGIDGVYITHQNNIVPYQNKLYPKVNTISAGYVWSFLAVTDEFKKNRVIVSNATTLGKKVLQRRGVRGILHDYFDELSPQMWKDIEYFSENQIVPKHPSKYETDRFLKSLTVQPRTAIKKHFNTSRRRGKVVMCCGSGKSVVGSKSFIDLKADTAIIFVPSLYLINQLIHTWLEVHGNTFDYLAVCSDQKVNTGAEKIVEHTNSLSFYSTNDYKDVSNFLADTNGRKKVIFSTYHSVRTIEKGAKGHIFDLGIFDEAQYSATTRTGLYARALFENNIAINYRMFMTATPKTLERKRGNKKRVVRVCMNDNNLYGKVIVDYPFKMGVDDGILAPMKLVAPILTSTGLQKEIISRGLLKRNRTSVKGDDAKSEFVAKVIALQDTMNSTKTNKCLGIFSRLIHAQEFIKFAKKIMPSNFEFYYIDGEMSMDLRRKIMKKYTNTKNPTIIVTSKALGVGVDLPATEIVYFNDPKEGVIDIVQNMGRGSRIHNGKTCAYVCIPLFIEDDKNETLLQAAQKTGYLTIVETFGEMMGSSDAVSEVVRDANEALGADESVNPRSLKDFIQVIHCSTDTKEIEEVIHIAIFQSSSVTFDVTYGAMKKQVKETGSCMLDSEHKQYSMMRSLLLKYNDKSMSIDNRKKLKALPGFVSDIWSRDAKFKKLEAHLDMHVKLKGTANVKKDYKHLGWCSYCNKNCGYATGTQVSKYRVRRSWASHKEANRVLASKKGWVWVTKVGKSRVGVTKGTTFTKKLTNVA